MRIVCNIADFKVAMVILHGGCDNWSEERWQIEFRLYLINYLRIIKKPIKWD